MNLLKLFIDAWTIIAPRRPTVPKKSVCSHNPSGSKLLRKAYKSKQGRRGTFVEAKEWYDSLAMPTLRSHDAKKRAAMKEARQ